MDVGLRVMLRTIVVLRVEAGHNLVAALSTNLSTAYLPLLQDTKFRG